MKVFMYVCVCMSGGLPPDPHKPSPRNLAWAPPDFLGSSFHPGSAPSQGATQNVGPQRYLPY